MRDHARTLAESEASKTADCFEWSTLVWILNHPKLRWIRPEDYDVEVTKLARVSFENALHRPPNAGDRDWIADFTAPIGGPIVSSLEHEVNGQDLRLAPGLVMRDRSGLVLWGLGFHYWILAIRAHPTGQGIGSALLAQSLAHAKSDGGYAASVEIDEDRQSVVRFFQRHGFQRYKHSWGPKARYDRLL